MKKIALELIIQLSFLALLFFSFKAAKTNFERIDTHIHLYDTRRVGSCIFLDPVDHRKIYFPHFIDEFIKVAHPAGIKYAIVIEASFRREDNFWLATLAENSNIIKAFLANLDPRDPNFTNDLDSLLHYKKFRGIRIRTEKKIDLSKPEIIKTIGELEKRNLVLEVNRYDPGIVKIARKYPKMTIIMDHLAGGHIENGSVQPNNWKENLAFMAAEPNIYCKISALFTLSGKIPAPTDPAFYKPLINPVIDTFGSERVMFGSDWPLSEMGGSYADLITMYNAYLNGRADLIPQKFYFYTAMKAYGIE